MVTLDCLARFREAAAICVGLALGVLLIPTSGHSAPLVPGLSAEDQTRSPQLQLVQGNKQAAESKDTSETSSRKNEPPPRKGRSGGGEGERSIEDATQVTYKTPYEVWLTLLTVVLAVGTLGLFCFTNRGDARDINFPRHFIIISVIFAALFLIVAGYTEKQTAPVFGLLGTIVGYLFGMTSQRGMDGSAKRDSGQSGGDADGQKEPKK